MNDRDNPASLPVAGVMEASRDMLQRQLYAMFTTPLDGMGPVLAHIQDPLDFQSARNATASSMPPGPCGPTTNSPGKATACTSCAPPRRSRGQLYKANATLTTVEEGITDMGWVFSFLEPAKLPLRQASSYAPFSTDNPPSLLMIVHAVLAEESVGRMFLAGIGPGILPPIALPVAGAAGFDMIWFGVLPVVAVDLGPLTPPFVLSVYTIKSAMDDPDLRVGDIFRGAFPFVLAMVVAQAIIIAAREIATWLAGL